MSDQNDPSRNQPATAKRLSRARKDGNVPRSRELGHFAALAVAALLLQAFGGDAVEWARQLLVQGLTFDRQVVLSPQRAGEMAVTLVLRGVLVVAGFGLLMGAVGVASTLAVGGWNFTMKAVSPNFGRMNPLAGLMRLFSKDQLMNALKGVALALVIGTVGAVQLKAHAGDLARALAASLPQGLQMIGETVQSGLRVLLVVLAAWAAFDVPFQKYRWHARLRMTREEIKQEHKESEGNGEVKNKIKQKMRQLARRRMMQAVPAADIVVMNPTHYAVALKYDEAAGGAPRVTAKGTDRLALRIRDLAREAGVPVLEAPPLARALYTHVDLDGEVPTVLFAAVAQVLAWVYRMRQTPMAANLPPQVAVPTELDPLTNPDLARPGARRRARPVRAAATSTSDQA